MIAGSVFAANDSLGPRAIEKLKTIFTEKANADVMEAEGFCQGDDCLITDERVWGVVPAADWRLRRRAQGLRGHRLREVQGLMTMPNPTRRSGRRRRRLGTRRHQEVRRHSRARRRVGRRAPQRIARAARAFPGRVSRRCCAASTACIRSRRAPSRSAAPGWTRRRASQLRALRRERRIRLPALQPRRPAQLPGERPHRRARAAERSRATAR